MSQACRWRKSGRVSLSALGVITLAVVAAGLVLAPRAPAATTKSKVVAFGPVELNDGSFQGVRDISLDLQLPDTTNATRGFRVHILTAPWSDFKPDSDTVVDVPRRGISFDQFELHMGQENSQEYLFISEHGALLNVVPLGLPNELVSIRVEPAIVNGVDVRPQAASMTISGGFGGTPFLSMQPANPF